MKHAPLFAGINGFGLAAEEMEWDQQFHCEIDEFCQKIIQYYWPQSKPYYDIRQTDFTIWRGLIDVLSGGFPCQPYSQAGKRLGKEDDRHLWPEMLRAVREIQPPWVVGENVRGLTNWNGGLVFDEVQADLEAEGYEVTPFLLPACAVNAPHRRDRIWFVAYNNSSSKRKSGKNEKAEGKGTSSSEQGTRGRIETVLNSGLCGISRSTSDATSGRRIQDYEQFWSEKLKCFSSGWEWFPTQSPICSGNDGISSKLDGITFPKWRAESIKAYGNAIVPQVALQIFKAIQEYENLR